MPKVKAPVAKKVKGLFDHINAIYQDQSLDYWDKLDESDRKTYSTYMVNRFLSMNMDYIPFVNAFQKYNGEVNNKISYLFYSQLLPRGRQFNRYIKGSKEEKYEAWAIDLIARYFGVSLREAEEYIGLWLQSKEGTEEFKQVLTAFGVEPKKIQKVTK